MVASTATDARRTTNRKHVTKEQVYGTDRRWRRFGEPVPAGTSLREDGTPDLGLFGPGSLMWEVILHPAVIVFETPAQVHMQFLYRPIGAGIRDWDPVSRRAIDGTLTFYDSFERVQRNAGMHAPMWLGDTTTATRMWKHLLQIHRSVRGELMDTGAPELGGYDAAGQRESMWAALSELHPMLHIYEKFAFRDGRLPRRLSDAERDQYVAEGAAYVNFGGADPAETPTTMAELDALYDKYRELWTHSKTLHISPETGKDVKMTGPMLKNFHITQMRLFIPLVFQLGMYLPVMGAFPDDIRRRAAGFGPVRDLAARASLILSLPVIWFMQRPRIERYFMRLMWGPDGVRLIESARELHEAEKRRRREAATR